MSDNNWVDDALRAIAAPRYRDNFPEVRIALQLTALVVMVLAYVAVNGAVWAYHQARPLRGRHHGGVRRTGERRW